MVLLWNLELGDWCFRLMSLLIRGGEIVTPNEQYVADIFCEGETITRIEPNIQAPG